MVLWLETDPDDSEGLILCEATFSTEEERNAHLAERIETGLVYDLVGVIDSSWVEVEDPLPEVDETTENGLIPTNKPKESSDEQNQG